MEWIADLTYQLLLSPIVVPIQGALLGMAGGGMGLPGGAGGMVGGAANVASGIGGMSNMFSGLSSGFNVISNLFSGATFAGITQGFSAATGVISSSGYFGGFGANMAMASGAASSGSTGFAIGAAMPYLIPAAIAVAGIGAIVSKWQKDQEPRYGTLVGMTGGSVAGLEDWENGPANYSRGAFGVTFGISDKGSKNMKASELKKTYDALAEVTDVLAKFFGDDLTAFITEELKTLSTFGDGLLHLTENEGDLGAAMAMLVENIATAAGRSSEDIGIAFGALVGDLGGTVDEVAAQIQSAMQAATMALALSEKHGSRIGEMLGLTGAVDKDAARLRLLTDKFGRQSENTGDTINRLVNQLVLLDTASRDTATSLAGLSTSAMVELSDAMVDAFGGLDAASQAIAVFDAQFRTDAERLTQAIMAASKNISTGLNDMIEDLAGNLGGADLAILREQLMGPLLASRDGFIELIESIDLTTEAGRNLYAALLKLAPEFDLIYDGVEAFTDWLLGVDDVARATRTLTEVFAGWGMTLPTNRDALLDLYNSGTLTTEQMAILAAHLRDLGVLFGTMPTPGSEGVTVTPTEKAQAAYDVLARAISAERDKVNATYQARIDALNGERESINAAYSARVSALNAERDAISQAGEARLAALATEREAAQEALSAARSSLSSIQSAIASLRGNMELDELARARAQRQLAEWAKRGILPDSDALAKVIPAATTINPADFATEAAYRASQGNTMSSLKALEKLGLDRVSVAERTLNAIEAQTERIQASTQAQLDAVQRQIDSAATWRDQQLAAIEEQMAAAEQWRASELERLDALLEIAKQELDAALGKEEVNLSLPDAIKAFNDAILAIDPERTPIALATIDTTLQDTSTKIEAAITQQSVQNSNNILLLRTEIVALRNDLAASGTAQVSALKSLDDRLKKWDLDGVPPGRDAVDVILTRAA